MRRVIVANDLNYGASKTSATKHTALLALDLAVGAIGVYGIPKTSTNNKDKMALITNAGSDAAGLVPDSAFDGNAVVVAVGKTNGNESSEQLWLSGKNSVDATGYAVAVYQVVDIDIVPDATIAKNQEAQLRITDLENLNQGGSIRTNSLNFNIATADSDTEYNMSLGLVELVNAHQKQWMEAEITSTTAGAVFTTSATVTAVNGAISLTTSAAHGVGVGDYVRLNSDTYLAITGTASTTLVLDSPYRGISETIANANTKDLGTSPGDIGINLTSLILGRNFGISVDGVIADSAIVVTTAGTWGQGMSDVVKDMENEARGYKGSTAGATDATMPFPVLNTVDGVAYDMYTFTSENPRQERTGGTAGKAHNLYTELIVVFPDGGSNDGQGDFEAVLGEVLFGAADLGGIA